MRFYDMDIMNCKKCKKDCVGLILTNGYKNKIILCPECHKEYMELTKNWLED